MSAPQPLIPLMGISSTHPTLPASPGEVQAIRASQQQMQQSAEEQPGRLAMQAAQLLGLQTQVQGEQQELQDQQKWRAAMADPNWDGTPQDLLQKGLKQGVGPKSYATVSQGLAQTGEMYAKFGSEQLNLQNALSNHIGDQLESIGTAAPADRLAVQQQAKQNAVTWLNSTPGLNPAVRQNLLSDIQKNIPDDVPMSDDQLKTYESHLKLHSALVEQGLKVAQTQEAAGKGAYQQAEAGKIAAQQNPQSPLYAPTPQAVALGSAPGATQIQTGEAQQAGAMKQAQGQVTPAERFAQQNENYREQMRIKAAQGQGAALANVPAHLVAPASAGAEKIGQEYADAVAAGDDMNTFLSLAAQGNKIAYSYAPTEGVLTLNTAKGVKRVNLPEIQSYAGAGSAGDRLQAFFGKQTSGASIPDDVLKDMGVLHQALTANAQTRYNNKLKVLNQTYGSNFQPTQLSSGGGGGGPVDVTDPNGGIHRFPDQKSADAFEKGGGYPVSGGAQVDYEALAKQNGAIASMPAQVDYDALAKQSGALASLPAGPPTGNAGTAEHPLVTPLPGESFEDTMKRATAMGKRVTPQQIQTATSAAIRQVPTVLGAAALSGPALLGAGAILPAYAAEAVGGGFLGDVVGGATGGAALNMLTQPTQGQNPFSVKGLEQAGEAGVIGGVTAGAFNVGGSLLRNVLGNTPVAKLNLFPPAAEMQPALANTPKEILDYAANKGVDLTPGQALNTPLAKTVEAVGERSLAGGNALADARSVNAMKLSQNVRGIADAADPAGLGISEEQAGDALQQSVKQAQDNVHQAATAAYQKLPQQFMDAPVNLSGVRSQYFQKLRDAEVALANRNPAIASQIRGALEQGANLGTPSVTIEGVPYMRPELKVSDLLKVRSDAIQDGGALARAGAPNEVQATYRQLSQDIDGLVEAQAKNLGVEDQWRQANAGWRDYQQKFNNPQSPLYQIGSQADPAKVTRRLLNNGSASDVQLMQQVGMDSGLQALRRQALTDIANRGFKVTGDGLGGYSDSFLKQLFGQDATKELYLNGELARRMGFQVNPSGTSNVLLGRDQLSLEPNRWMIPVGAAKVSMPRPAGSFLPAGNPTPFAPTAGATLGSLATPEQKRDPDTGRFISSE